MKKVLVFGTFDGVHDGHRAMLREARKITNPGLVITDNVNPKSSTTYNLPPTTYLVAAVAPDSVVLKLKNHTPRHSQAERIQMLKNEHLVDEVILADDSVGDWKIIKKVKPSVIALGYDQDELRASLEEFLDSQYPHIETEEGWKDNPKRPTITILSAHKPDTHHSRLLAP